MVKMEKDHVLFIRGSSNEESNASDDIWDDSALIKAYDKAINLAKEEAIKRMGLEDHGSQSKQTDQNKFSKSTNKFQKKWVVGSPCRTVYSEDGEIYEAVITKLHEKSGTCIVKFVGYGNTEKVELSSLLESEGLQSQLAQKEDALAERCNQENGELDESSSPTLNFKKINRSANENMDCDQEETKCFSPHMPSSSYFSSLQDMMPPAPPIPPHLMAKLPENDADALSSMLMSWYISGFHTGYYHGLKQAKK
ncbi:survival motor neuron protein [Prorops nasuta]|uniref:survival motor neuron protein n=1 Tax=Prorops nasuta TaxID=863751 RepID=UPI0034CFE8A3